MAKNCMPTGFAAVPGFPGYAANRDGKLLRKDKSNDWLTLEPTQKGSGSYTFTQVVLRSKEKGIAQISPSTLVTMTFGFDDLPGEKWRPIDGWTPYEVSNEGRVRRLRKWAPRLLEQTPDRDGYKRVTLSYDGDVLTFGVHILVLKSFGRKPNPGEDQGRHLDGVVDNNRDSNLDWGTHTDNRQDALFHGTVPSGAGHAQARLTNRQALAIYRSDASNAGLAKRYGVSDRLVSYIRSGERWASVTGHKAGSDG